MKRSLFVIAAGLACGTVQATTCQQQVPQVLEQLQSEVLGELSSVERQRAQQIIARLCSVRAPGSDRNLRTAPIAPAPHNPAPPAIIEPIILLDGQRPSERPRRNR